MLTYPKIFSSLQSSCLSLLKAEITGQCHHSCFLNKDVLRNTEREGKVTKLTCVTDEGQDSTEKRQAGRREPQASKNHAHFY